MRNTNPTLLALACCFALFSTGCAGGGENAGGGHDAHSDDDGHDHGSAEDDAHSDDDGHEHGEDDDHEHGGEVHELGAVTAAGTTLSVTVGHVEAGAEVDVELARTGGPVPDVIRVWIGLESGIGSLKVKADAHDDHYHAHVEVPEALGADARLWIQLDSAAGEAETQGLDLPDETHGE